MHGSGRATPGTRRLNESKNCEKAMGLVPNYFLQSKIFVKPPQKMFLKNKLYFYWSLSSLFSMRNIATYRYMAGMDGIRQRRTI